MTKNASFSSSQAHIPAPNSIKQLQKYYQKSPPSATIVDEYILDLNSPSEYHTTRLARTATFEKDKLNVIWDDFTGGEDGAGKELTKENKQTYEHSNVPGLKIIPHLLPPEIQSVLLDRLLLRDLADPAHLTNLHAHYHVPRQSLFHLDADLLLDALDAGQHKPLKVRDALERKLRWMTLGGQYDWTRKEYPRGTPVTFPLDLGRVVHALFPSITPEAAICNTYSPGDTLSPHRDVSEQADAELVSLSIGCDALFLISMAEDDSKDEDAIATIAPVTLDNPLELPAQVPSTTNSKHKKKKPPKSAILSTPPPRDDKTLLLRIRSGDVIVMSGASRWAWHGVPRIFEDGCPLELESWPEESGLERWKGWMKGKRVNLNVRQMFDHVHDNV